MVMDAGLRHRHRETTTCRAQLLTSTDLTILLPQFCLHLVRFLLASPLLLVCLFYASQAYNRQTKSTQDTNENQTSPLPGQYDCQKDVKPRLVFSPSARTKECQDWCRREYCQLLNTSAMIYYRDGDS
jgi:hypothetical protein